MSKSVKKTSSKKTTTKKSVKKEGFVPFSLPTYTAVSFIAFLVALLGVVYYFYNESKGFERPDYEPVATVYHSEMLGMDAGDEYIYSIFENKNSKSKSYFYIKSKAKITMVGSSQSEDVSSGSLNSRTDLKKITKDIEKDTSETATKNVSYRYLVNGQYVNIDTIEELENKLFS